MKKRWRDRPPVGDVKQLEVSVHLQQRGPDWYAHVPLGWLAEVVEDGRQRLDEFFKDLARQNLKDLCIEGDDVILGPFPTKLGAEGISRGFVQVVCDQLGIQRDGGPEVRDVAGTGGLIADFNTSRATDPRKLGGPPADLDHMLERASELIQRGYDATTLMVAAWRALQQGTPKHPLAFISLARAVISWLHEDPKEQTPLKLMEQHGRQLATVVSSHLGPGEEFILIIANQGEGGSMTHIGSMQRETMIELLGEFVEHLQTDQQRIM